MIISVKFPLLQQFDTQSCNRRCLAIPVFEKIQCSDLAIRNLHRYVYEIILLPPPKTKTAAGRKQRLGEENQCQLRTHSRNAGVHHFAMTQLLWRWIYTGKSCESRDILINLNIIISSMFLWFCPPIWQRSNYAHCENHMSSVKSVFLRFAQY